MMTFYRNSRIAGAPVRDKAWDLFRSHWTELYRRQGIECTIEFLAAAFNRALAAEGYTFVLWNREREPDALVALVVIHADALDYPAAGQVRVAQTAGGPALAGLLRYAFTVCGGAPFHGAIRRADKVGRAFFASLGAEEAETNLLGYPEDAYVGLCLRSIPQQELFE